MWSSDYGRLAALYVHAEVALAVGELQAALARIEQLRSCLAAQDGVPENALLLEAVLAHLHAAVALALGNRTASDAAERRAAEIVLRLQPVERRLITALADARRAARQAHERYHND